MINIKDEALIKGFGNRVRALRIEKGLTMEKLAELAGIDYRQLSYIELGQTNPTISTVNAIAKGLKITIKQIFDFET